MTTVSVSDSLKTHDVWQKSVGHDPYRGDGEDAASSIIPEVGEINSSAKGLFRLAQLTGQSSTLAPGACKRCGSVGHLYFQCRNFLIREEKKAVVEEDDEESGSDDDSGSGSDSSSSSGKKKKKKKSKKRKR